MTPLIHTQISLSRSATSTVLAIVVSMLLSLNGYSQTQQQTGAQSSQQSSQPTSQQTCQSSQPAQPQAQQQQFLFRFPINGSSIINTVGNNAQEADSVRALMARINGDSLLRLDSVKISAAASPEGRYDYNMRLAGARRAALSLFAIDSCGIPADRIILLPCPEPQETLRQYLAQLPASEQHPDPSTLRKIYPLLRYATMEVNFKNYPPQSKAPVSKEIIPADTIQEDSTQGIDTPQFAIEPSLPIQPWRAINISTNLLELGLLIPNLAVEYRFNSWGSVSLAGDYSAWNYFSSTLKFRATTVSGELRVWPAAKPTGFFAGAHAITGIFNIALGQCDPFRRQSHNGATLSYGGGLTFGYRIAPFRSPNWQMEVSAGAGVHSLYYDEFQNRPNGLLVGSQRKLYYGPDRAGVSLIYHLPIKKKGGEP